MEDLPHTLNIGVQQTCEEEGHILTWGGGCVWWL